MVNVKSSSNVVNSLNEVMRKIKKHLAAALRELEEVEAKLLQLEKNQVERKVELRT